MVPVLALSSLLAAGSPSSSEDSFWWGGDNPQSHSQVTGSGRSASGANEEAPELGATKDKTFAETLGQFVSCGGAIEAEAQYKEDFEPSTNSTLELSTAELEFKVSLVEWANGWFGIEWDRDDDRFGVKEVFITLGKTESFPAYLRAGRLIVPFGIGTGAVTGDTLTITDPLTIEIFETKEDVALLGFENDMFEFAGYVFNGMSNRGGGNDHIDQWGLTARCKHEWEHGDWHLGADFMSSAFDTDKLQETFPDALVQAYAPALDFHGYFDWKGISLILEYGMSLHHVRFEIEEEEIVRLKPRAWHCQVGYETLICDLDWYAAFNYSGSNGLAGQFPMHRFLVSTGLWMYEGILLAFEYGREIDYGRAAGGTGKSGNSVTTQLTFEW